MLAGSLSIAGNMFAPCVRRFVERAVEDCVNQLDMIAGACFDFGRFSRNLTLFNDPSHINLKDLTARRQNTMPELDATSSCPRA